MTHSSNHRESDTTRRGFSLIEILVTCALLSVIILGLVAMFNQTRKAFTSSITQVDVLEAGRSAAELIGREVEQMAVAGTSSNVPNFYVGPPFGAVPRFSPMIQPLIDPADSHTNNIQEFYFLSRFNQGWQAIGYKLFPAVPGGSLGTLYRFNSNNISTTNFGLIMNLTSSPFLVFSNTTDEATAKTIGFNHIMDGVVDFRIHVYDTNGNLFTNQFTGSAAVSFPTTSMLDYSYRFFTNALPGYVEIELGVVEDRTLARYLALTNNSTVANNYLINHPGQVHIFRQRIPIRNANSAAYQ